MNFPTNCLSVFGNFVGLALKGLNNVKNNVFNSKKKFYMEYK